MSGSEQQDSEFHYAGELSDSEMPQLPTHNEATERKALLSNQEIKKFITSQQQANTVKKTTTTNCGVSKFPLSSVDGE